LRVYPGTERSSGERKLESGISKFVTEFKIGWVHLKTGSKCERGFFCCFGRLTPSSVLWVFKRLDKELRKFPIDANWLMAFSIEKFA
jgi:hypothetical protein